MSLFAKFRDTIFLKEDSELENKIKALKQIQDEVLEKDKIKREIKLSELGLIGEKNIQFELKHANIGMYVLHDINIAFEDVKAQIDYIIITAAHCYIVECKNLLGNITINKDGEFRREYELNGKKIKEAIYSPYTQALRHKDVLKKIWSANGNKILTSIFENSFEQYYKPLVVFANAKGLLNNKYAPSNIRECTIRVDNLVEYLKKDIADTKLMNLDTQNAMRDFAMDIRSLHVCTKKDYACEYTFCSNLQNKQDKQDKHDEQDVHFKQECKKISKIEKKIDNNHNIETIEKIREALLNFRKEKCHQMNVPAYYIFKNDELENLLAYMPKSLDELKELKILEPIKLKCHGEEIIKIINELNK